jgi:hypothetical protein
VPHEASSYRAPKSAWAWPNRGANRPVASSRPTPGKGTIGTAAGHVLVVIEALPLAPPERPKSGWTGIARCRMRHQSSVVRDCTTRNLAPYSIILVRDASFGPLRRRSRRLRPLGDARADDGPQEKTTAAVDRRLLVLCVADPEGFSRSPTRELYFAHIHHGKSHAGPRSKDPSSPFASMVCLQPSNNSQHTNLLTL